MNDRIREFVEQATISYSNGQERTFDKEKFAELIVRECAKICDDIGRQARKDWKAKYDPVDDGRCNGAWECEESIKEYFGVA